MPQNIAQKEANKRYRQTEAGKAKQAKQSRLTMRVEFEMVISWRIEDVKRN